VGSAAWFMVPYGSADLVKSRGRWWLVFRRFAGGEGLTVGGLDRPQVAVQVAVTVAVSGTAKAGALWSPLRREGLRAEVRCRACGERLDERGHVPGCRVGRARPRVRGMAWRHRRRVADRWTLRERLRWPLAERLGYMEAVRRRFGVERWRPDGRRRGAA